MKEKTMECQGKRERCTYIQDTKKNKKIEEKTIRYEGKNYEISRKKREMYIYIQDKKKTTK